MLVESGTTTVGDFENVPELLPDVWETTALRVVSFLELTGVRSRRSPAQIVREAVERIEALPAGRCRAVLAPHALYSTVPELVRLSAKTARRRRWPMAMHLAESSQEYEMFCEARGELFDWLGRNARDMADCGVGTPVRQAGRCGALGRNLLAVHVNYLGAKEAALLAERKVSVAHCPRSHAYFGHQAFPFRRLMNAGVNVCLGTDSLATVWAARGQVIRLDLFEEMRAFAEAHPEVPARTILRMATVNGARALQLAGRAGRIAAGAFADLIAVPFTGKRTQLYEGVLDHRGVVAASMIDGQWVIPPGADK
jgi:cytosine/adenosine deaminase-related metal-dependent hydrolase